MAGNFVAARPQVNNRMFNAGAIPTTAPAPVSGNSSDASWNPAVVSTNPGTTGKYDLLIIVGLVLLVVIFERNS